MAEDDRSGKSCAGGVNLEEWKIFLTLGEILALFFLVGKPILKLNGTLTSFREEIKYLREKLAGHEQKLDSQKEAASKSHKELWDHEREQDKTLANHEGRIELLEKRK